ncbi:hypothetical protein M434DRAFT_396038 [Hypoxylon sp. CO27-5]|nr:hypothetical protein M434DRAFT_396038 [Hypoxylon sp. CO27-5]
MSVHRPTMMQIHQVGFGLWQLVCVIARRWPLLQPIQGLMLRFTARFDRASTPWATLRELLGDDCGQELKALIRARSDPFPDVPCPGDSGVMAALTDVPMMYCPKQDIGLLSLGWERYIWAVDLRRNIIRAIDVTRVYFDADLEWKLKAVDEDEEDIIIPCDTSRDLKWVLEYLNKEG